MYSTCTQQGSRFFHVTDLSCWLEIRRVGEVAIGDDPMLGFLIVLY